MRYITYKKVKAARSIIFIVFLGLMVVAASMLYYDISKVIFFNTGEGCYAEGKLVQAEGWFTNAKSHSYFEFKDKEIAERLEQLKNVTVEKQFMDNISRALEKADDSKDAEALLTQYNKYMDEYDKQSKLGSQNEQVFEEIAKDFDIDDDLTSYFEAARFNLKDAGDRNIKNKDFSSEGFKDTLIKIPDKFFGGTDNKKKEIEKVIQEYDSKKLDIVLSQKGGPGAVDEANKIIAFSSKNSLDYGWLIDKLESAWSGIVKQDMDKSDYESLFSHYEYYKGFIKNYLTGSKVISAVDNKIADDYKTAKSYADSGKYAEAIDAFNKISKFIDTKQDVKNTRIKWIEHAPSVALNDAFPGESYRNVLFGQNAWGASAYVLGYDSSSVYLVRFNDDFQPISCEYGIGNLQSEIKSLRVMGELNHNGPVILVEGSSGSRKAEYVGLALNDSNFSELFRFEADGFSVESSSRLVVDNPVGKGADRQCYYTLSGDHFEYSSNKKDYADINLANVNDYKSGKIRFSCTLYKFYSYSNSALVTDGTNYVLLNNVSGLNGNTFYVIGRYDGAGAAMKDGKTITVPAVYVLEIQN